ncbi:hypothetical protein C464_02730 [Halorubrum coriense DSM 10284]|uniref:Uncharacterized protein n=1 Tax=Halorubrum coriense DSM 10284 TaxID=1227466 RepID=M0ES13_9EURY|nr:hypothetical protein C464_02730 [Halorubrum coriense DSM 10284]
MNIALIVAIIGFQWSLLEIAVMYVLEIAIVNVLYLFVALFTPQPLTDSDEERWNTKPTPIQPISRFPAVYYRNARFILRYVLSTGILIPVLLQALVAQFEVESIRAPSVGLVVVGITLFELHRVWQNFIRDQQYLEKSPLDAVQFGFVPLSELFIISVYVIVPVTVIIVVIGIAFEISYEARITWLAYLIPMGAVRVWFSGLDPQTDDVEVSFS